MHVDSLAAPAITRRIRLARTWLLLGAAIMLLRYITPLRLLGPGWGATPTFWLLLAPLSVLATLRPEAPLRLCARWLRAQPVPTRLRSIRRRNSCITRR